MSDLISRESVLARVRLNYTIHQTVERHEIEDIIKSEPSAENKGDLISRQAIEEIKSEIPKIHELFDIAYEYNQEDSTSTELSQKCTTYLLDVWQTLGAIVDNYSPVENKGEWTPVSERLPRLSEDKREVEVIVSYENEDGEFVTKGMYGKKYGFNFPSVKAWQPLPEPYKAESEGV